MRRLAQTIILFALIGWGSSFSVTARQSVERPVITPENAGQLVELRAFGRGWIHQVAWSPDGRQLAVASSNGLYLYDAEDWSAPPVALPGYEQPVTGVVWRMNGTQLVSIDAMGYLRLWQFDSGGPVEGEIAQAPAEYRGHDWRYKSRRSVALDGNDVLLFTGDPDCGDCLWNLQTEQYLSSNEYWFGYIRADGRWFKGDRFEVASETQYLLARARCLDKGRDPHIDPACDSSVVQVTDKTTGEQVDEYYTRHVMQSNGVSLSQDGRFLAVTGCSRMNWHYCQEFDIQVYARGSGELTVLAESFEDTVQTLVFTANSAYLAGADSSWVRIWEVSTGRLVAELPGYGGPVQYLAYEPRGVYFVSGHTTVFGGGRAINVWDENALSTGEPLAQLVGTGPFAFSADKALVAGNTHNFEHGASSTAAWWNLSDPLHPSLREDVPVLVQLENVSSLAVAADEGLLAAQVNGTNLVIWDLNRPALLSNLRFPGFCWEVILAPDHILPAPIIWTGRGCGAVMLDAAAVKEFGVDNAVTRDTGLELEGQNMLFSPDGRLLAATIGTWNDTLILYDTQTFNRVAELPGLAAEFTSLAFSPDSRLLAAGGCARNDRGCEEYAVWLIDLDTMEIIASILGLEDRVNTILFSPDGTLLLTGHGMSGAYLDDSVNAFNGVRAFGVPAG